MVAVSTLDLAPGVYDLSDDDYHARPELSNTDARRILECPAKYIWLKSHQEESKHEFDFGHAAHRSLLGAGASIEVCDYDDWRTKDAKTERDEARANGRTPVLAREWATVEAMADTLRAHPIVSRLLAPERGRAEQSMFWTATDPFLATEVRLRARLDWLPEVPASGRLIVTDYKTAASAEARAFARSAANYGYHQQAAWYLDGVKALLGVEDPAFVFVVQERTPPYVVNVIELDAYALQIGRERNAAAINRYVECSATGVWPAYSSDVELVALPRWAEMQWEQDNE
jgi:hypothetical protein